MTLFVVDTSAIVAIILDEPEAEVFQSLMVRVAYRISAVSVFEAETVLRGRRNGDVADRVRRPLSLTGAVIVPFDDPQARSASKAYAVFGKGIHPARLKLCDCAAYALAKSLDLPLLYKGNDFSQTDIRCAVTSG